MHGTSIPSLAIISRSRVAGLSIMEDKGTDAKAGKQYQSEDEYYMLLEKFFDLHHVFLLYPFLIKARNYYF
ncbi:MAG TPA: hypothetical protein DCS83_04785 [Prevotella sp.]|nr:hypothetical protein [Prevotella sp.]